MTKNNASLGTAQALVVDPVAMSRSVLTAQLKDFGLGSVVACGKMSEARKLIEARSFDVVLCEMDFQSEGGSAYSGQEFLEDLRRERRMPLSTVFIMVTGERAYAKVAEAAETALDSYLLKPFTARELLDRVTQSRHRKEVLKDIFNAIDRGEYEPAARLCIQRFQARSRYWLYAARLGAELLLRLNMHEPARQLLDAVVGTQALPWARLGLAQIQLATQQTSRAMCTLELLILEEPEFADAYDVMGRAQLAQGDFEDALETYRNAAALTPASVHRQQALGTLAYYCGDHTTATRALERAMALGQGTRQFDYQALVLLSALHFRSGDVQALRRCLGHLQQACEQMSENARVRRMRDVVNVFDLMLQRQVARVLQALKALVAESRDPDFDIEAACNLLIVVARLTAAELQLADADDWVNVVTLRFGGVRSTTEMLARAAEAHPPYAERVRQSHAAVLKSVQAALTHSLQGRPEVAVGELLAMARKTLNQKCVDTAQGVLQRYADDIADKDGLQAELATVTALMKPAPVAKVRTPVRSSRSDATPVVVRRTA